MAFDAPANAAATAPEDPARAAARRAAEKLDQHATAFIPDVSAWQFGILAAREALASCENRDWRQEISSALGVQPGETNLDLTAAEVEVRGLRRTVKRLERVVGRIAKTVDTSCTPEDLVGVIERSMKELNDPYSELNQKAGAWDAVAAHPLIAVGDLPEGDSYAKRVAVRLDQLGNEIADKQASQEYWRDRAMDDVDRLNIIAEIEPDPKSVEQARFVRRWLSVVSPVEVRLSVAEVSNMIASIECLIVGIECARDEQEQDDELVANVASIVKKAVVDTVGAFGITTSTINDVDYESTARSALRAAGLLESASE